MGGFGGETEICLKAGEGGEKAGEGPFQKKKLKALLFFPVAILSLKLDQKMPHCIAVIIGFNF